MDPFQREVIDRLARIETKIEPLGALEQRVVVLEKGEGRRNAVVALILGVPAAVGAVVTAARSLS